MNRILVGSILTIVTFFISTFSCFSLSETQKENFENANRLFEKKEYKEAIQGYQDLLQDGLLAKEIFLNLGNAWMAEENIPEAIVAFERGLLLAPLSSELNKNLLIALNKQQEATQTSTNNDPRRSILKKLHLGVWALLAAIPLTVFVVSIGISFLDLPPGNKLSGLCKSISAPAGILSLILVILFFLSYKQWNTTTGIITEYDIGARFGPVSESEVSFTTDIGDYLNVVDEHYDWYKIIDSKNRSGWILKKNLSIISPLDKALDFSEINDALPTTLD